MVTETEKLVAEFKARGGKVQNCENKTRAFTKKTERKTSFVTEHIATRNQGLHESW